MATTKAKPIDWARVAEKLRCPICGEKASIASETNGTEGYHTHRFKITPQMIEDAMKLDDNERKEARLEAVRLLREAGIDDKTFEIITNLHSRK